MPGGGGKGVLQVFLGAAVALFLALAAMSSLLHQHRVGLRTLAFTRVALENVEKDLKFAYRTQVPSSSNDWYRLYPVTIVEDGKTLENEGPSLRAVRENGEGNAMLLGNVLYFSTSDNTDLFSNGRSYEAEVPIPVPAGVARALYLATLLALVITCSVFVFAFPLKVLAPGRWAVHAAWAALSGCGSLVTPYLNMTVRRFLREFALAACVVAAALVVVEWGFRRWGEEPDAHIEDVIPWRWYQIVPYLGFTAQGPLDLDFDIKHGYSGAITRGKTRSNSLGFRIPEELNLTFAYEKADREKVVLLTGGSTAYGEGASDNGHTIAGALEQELNARQDVYRYTVRNFAMSGFVAYQQFIALDLWGSRYDPDWIITLDGRNDAHIAFWSGEKPPSYLHFQRLKHLYDSYLYKVPRPSFYRGRIENFLLKHSAALRQVTGKSYAPPAPDPKPRWGGHSPNEIEEVMQFYLKAIRSILHLGEGGVQFIMTIQPMAEIPPSTFGKTNEELAVLENKLDDMTFGYYMKEFLNYYYARLELELKAVASEHGPTAHYYPLASLFPMERQERIAYFTDAAHLNDEGQAIVARFYAERILEHDMGTAASSGRPGVDQAAAELP